MERRQGGQAKRMSEHDDDTCPHLVRASLLEAENSRLKAEVERLTALVESNLNSSKVAMGKADAVLHERDSLKAEVERLKEGNDCLDKMHDKEMERSAWLREEFNRTTAWGRGLESDLSHARVEISFLKAEVERLRKAGDAFYESEIGYYGEQILEDQKNHSGELCRNWLAAKEGKPSV
jgi:chromosome segregation ATPase